jgi:hypothetical protein
MSVSILPRQMWRLAPLMLAGALLAGVSGQPTLAQEAVAANAGAAAHAAPSNENKGGRFQALQPRMPPAQQQSIVHGNANVIDHNAIGISVVRPDGGQKPTGLNPGRAGTIVPPAPPLPPAAPGAVTGMGIRALPTPHVPAPTPPSPVLSRGTINGAAFTRLGAALAPLGGPAKHATAGINGTDIKPKH